MAFSIIQAWSGINHLYIYFTLGVTQTNPPAIYFNHPTILVNISNILSYVIEHYVLSVSTANCFPVLIFHAIAQWQVARPGHIQNFTSSEMVDIFLKLDHSLACSCHALAWNLEFLQITAISCYI